MGDRSQATRDTARGTMLASIGRVEDAITLFNNVTVTLSRVNSLTGGYINDLSQSDVDNLNTVLANAQKVSDKLKASIAGGTPLYVDSSAFGSGNVLQILPTTVADSDTWTLYPATLYTTDILNPAKLLATVTDASGNPQGIKLFGMNDYGRTYIDSQDAALDFVYDDLQIGVNWNRIAQLIAPSANVSFPKLDANGYFYLSVIEPNGEAMPYSVWRVIDWARGNNS